MNSKLLGIPIFRGDEEVDEEVYLHETGKGAVAAMDRERRGGSRDEKGSKLDKAGVATPSGGSGTPLQNDSDDAEEEEVEGIPDKEQRVRLSITLRRIRIDPREKRIQYIKRLERLMEECDAIIADPEGYEDIQVQAMGILIRAIRVCYELVTDEQVEQLEEEFERLKRKIAERLRGV